MFLYWWVTVLTGVATMAKRIQRAQNLRDPDDDDDDDFVTGGQGRSVQKRSSQRDMLAAMESKQARCDDGKIPSRVTSRLF